MKERIQEIEKEIELFKKELYNKQQIMQQIQVDIQQLTEGVLTRNGGIVELKKIIRKPKDKN